YSSVKAGFISPVRDQSPYGCCWAFSACASMEAAYAKRYGTPFMIFSPLNIVNRNPYNVDLDSGGNMIFVEGYLTKYLGPVKEADDPYKSPYKSPAVQPARAGFCENAQTLTDHTFGLTADELHAIKTMVYNQGAAEICFYHSSSYMSNDDISYYCNDNKGSVNHAVTVVGWDDNYSRKKFRTSPSGNGALLIKNSWGPYSHDNGYFWISYEDKTLTQSTAYDFVLPGDVPYTDRITYMSGAADDGVSARYGKVIYHPNEGGTVEAVQAYQYYGGQTIKIEIYVNDVLKGTATGGGDYPGFTTIYMPKSISFKAGDTIEADCDFNATGSSSFKYAMPVQTEIERLAPSFPYNTNFYSNNGTNYYDLYDYNFAMGISLLTGDTEIEPESLTLSITEKDIYVNERGSIIPTLLPEGAESTITWTSSKPDVVLIGKSGANCAYKGLKPGTSIITAVCDKNPKIKATCRINISNLLPTDIKLNTQTGCMHKRNFPDDRNSYSRKRHQQNSSLGKRRQGNS
ncbi:MAG: C1 family peptidase, partial [Armatimonadetes bacterium]|nr:C1 family peptidase [Candidatus Hippobium faecium]